MKAAFTAYALALTASVLAADVPRFGWRGFMLDTSRHFFTVDEVKKTLDGMQECGLNVFHWHLTDNEGWRAQVLKYPQLTEKGGVRKMTARRSSTLFADDRDGTFGPLFYTQDEMRGIVAYAAARGIRVVPEIEIPGHESAAIRAYPELGCEGLPNCGEFCVGREDAFCMMESILDEMLAIFPDKVVHIGGDECRYENWSRCAKCQARMKAVGAKNGQELQAWVTRRFAAFLAKRGRRMMGWDEITRYEGLPKDVIIHCYRGSARGIDAAKRGYDVVMSPSDFCYLDYSQGLSCDPYDYHPFGTTVSLAKIASFDPVAGVPAEIRHHILGGEGAAWTELIPDFAGMEWRVWPRLSALADVLTSGPSEDVSGFMARMESARARLVSRGVNAAPTGPLFKHASDLPADVRWETCEGYAKLLDNPLDMSVLQFNRKDERDKYRRVFAMRKPEMTPGTFRIVLEPNRVSAEAADDDGFRAALAVLKGIARVKKDGSMEFSGGVIVGGNVKGK